MIHFTTFFALVVGGMEVIQPAAAAVLADLSVRTNLNINMPFQRRQGNIPAVPAQCANICDPVNTIIGSGCTPSECCLASFENSYFNCIECVVMAGNSTDYTQAQMTIDELYDQCASVGIQLPVLTFPGQSPTQPLSPVISPTVSQITVSTIASTPSQSVIQSTVGPSTVGSTIASTPSQSVIQSTVGSSTVGSSTSPATTTASTQTTATTSTPTPTSSSSFGTKSTETSCFNLFFAAIMLGTWFYHVV